MGFLKSLFCIRGYDNGRRFLAINGLCYVFFLSLSGVLNQSLVLLMFLLLATTPLLATSAMRRIHDAGLATPIVIVPLAVYWLNILVIGFVEHNGRWSLLALALIVTAALTTIKNPKIRSQREYVLGYSGPVTIQGVEAASVSQRLHQRIEPVLVSDTSAEGLEGDSKDNGAEAMKTENLFGEAGASVDKAEYNESLASPGKPYRSAGVTGKAQAPFVELLMVNQKLLYVGGLVFALVLITIAFWPASKPDDTEQQVESKKAATIEQRLNKVELPDNFWLMHNQYDALTIAWQGDVKADGEIWSAMTGIEDTSCGQILFNDRVSFRVMRVTVKNGGDYYADFSPLDTARLVEAIAKQSRFKLCGYEFSLSGTQAKLMVHKKYADYLQID